VVVTGLDDNRRRALVIADNKLALNAGWDEDKLLIELQSMTVDMQQLVGFSQDELVAMLNPEQEDSFPDQQQLDATFEVAVECKNEEEQEVVFNMLNEKGYKCRILTM